MRKHCIIVTGLLMALLVGASLQPIRAGGAPPLSDAEIAQIKQQLKSTASDDLKTATDRLQQLDTIPDAFLDTFFDLYFHDDDTPKTPPTNRQEQMAILARKVALSFVIQPLWAKMNPEPLAKQCRPYLTDPATRLKVFEIIKCNPGTAHVLQPEIIKLLDDPDEGTVSSAIQVLAVQGSQASSVVPRLLTFLGDSRDQVREEASNALVAIGVTDKAVTDLLKGVAGNQLSVSQNCLKLLAKLNYNPEDYLPILLDGLNHGFNSDIVDLLVKVGPKAIPAVRDHAVSATFDSMDMHACVLRQFKDQSAKALAGDLHSTNANLRYLALDMAEEFPTETQKSPDWVRPYLSDPDKNIRVLALVGVIDRDKDTTRKLDLLGKSLADPDLQEKAFDLAADQGAAAQPLLPTLRAIIDKADDESKVPYLGDLLVIDPNDEKAYTTLVSYLHSDKDQVVQEALYILTGDTPIGQKAAPMLKQMHDDPATPRALKDAIANAQDLAARMKQADSGNK